jgi:transposase InsO family protein
MISEPDRRQTIELIETARRDGARLIPACQVLKISVRTYQRWTKNGSVTKDRRPDAMRPTPANKLTAREKQRVLDVCHRKENASLPPSQIVPKLADHGQYIASESTFYRILHEANEQHHRGRSQKPRKSTPPKGFCATGPNQVWTWDITWLPASIRGMFFYLYMIVDVFSRKIVGWEVFDRESSSNAASFVYKAVLAEGCILKPLVLHSDNGSPQKGFTLNAKLESLGITKSFSRPRVSNDNPFSEALFRTCKYRPDYPKTGFETIDVSRNWVSHFVFWYNDIHRHSAIRFVTPNQRHRREDREILEQRKMVYERAKSRNEKRWSGSTRNWDYIDHVWLNPPKCNNDNAANLMAVGF